MEERGKDASSKYSESTMPARMRGNHHQLCYCSVPFNASLTDTDMRKDIPIL
jgi:hypothetical protein